jgi:uncharacterized protein (DUF58 family)
MLRKPIRGLFRVLRFFLVRHRSLTALSVLFSVALAIAFANGFWLMARLANVILVALPIAFVWSWFNVRGLEVDVERPNDRLQVGDAFEERITVRNKTWFTKLWLEVEDLSELPGHAPRRVISLGPRAKRSWRTASECVRRGLYTVGPVRVSTSDLFGLFRRSRTFGDRHNVLVYPRAIELPRFWAPPAMLPGESRVRRPAYSVTPNAASVRKYQPGDAFNRIHWRSTARSVTGELMVKLFELDPASDVWIVLDLHGAVQAGKDDDSTEEHGVRIATSIARFFLFGNRSVGFVAQGKLEHIIEPERGIDQYARILEALAIAKAQGRVPLADLLNAEGRRFGRRTTVIVITPSTDEAWVGSLQLLASRGVKLAAVVMEPRTFGGEGNALLLFGELAAADIPTYLVKSSDDLSATLAAGAETAASGGVR